MTVSVLLQGLSYVVTVDAGDHILRDADLLIVDGVIAAVGPSGSLDVPRGAEVVSAAGRLALPGLVNLHTHLPMTLLRGYAENVDLQGFLERVWAAEAVLMDADTVRLGARLGAVESLLGGTTTALDMYFQHRAAHEGAVDAGLRHVGGPVFFDFPGVDGLSWEQRVDGLRRWPAELAEIGGPAVPVAAMPHGTYTVSVEHLRELAEVLGGLDASGTSGAGGAREVVATGEVGGASPRPMMTIHVSENAAENLQVVTAIGMTPTQTVGRAGWLDGTWAGRVVFGHGVHLDAADREIAAAGGAAVGHCPGSNLKLASGALDWRAWHADGVRVGIGTDGCSSSNDLDMWQAMRQAALLARLTSGDPATAPARQVLRAATIEGARALGMGSWIGSLEVGKRADIVLVNVDKPHLTPVHDVEALLVFAAGRGDVCDVLVDGAFVVRDGQATRIDVPELLAAARSRAAAVATL